MRSKIQKKSTEFGGKKVVSYNQIFLLKVQRLISILFLQLLKHSKPKMSDEALLKKYKIKQCRVNLTRISAEMIAAGTHLKSLEYSYFQECKILIFFLFIKLC